MRKSLFASILALVISPPCAAATIQSFAYQAQLGEADQALQRVILPVEIMLQLTRADLADISVFNANGKMLPHATAATPRTSREYVMRLPFHEFSRFEREHSRTVTRRKQNQQNGSISELQTIETVPVQTRRNAYLVELRPEDDSPQFDRIELEWTHQPASQWLELRVESGNELDSLRVIQRSKSLTNLDTSDIGWRSISGIPRKQKYLRLTPVNTVESFELQAVNGHYREYEVPPKLDYPVTPERVVEDNRVYYRFELPSRLRPEAMRIIPGDEHSVIRGDLYATWGDMDERRRIHSGFRQHNIGDADIKPSKPIKLGRRNFEQIWFSSEVELDALPRVELIYPQYEVVFLGDGNGPYRLAWGNYEIEPGQTDLRGLLDGSVNDALERGALVVLGDIETAGGPGRLAAQPALPWQKWLLWSLLILAALVTGRMALRLYREMNQAGQA